MDIIPVTVERCDWTPEERARIHAAVVRIERARQVRNPASQRPRAGRFALPGWYGSPRVYSGKRQPSDSAE